MIFFSATAKNLAYNMSVFNHLKDQSLYKLRYVNFSDIRDEHLAGPAANFKSFEVYI